MFTFTLPFTTLQAPVQIATSLAKPVSTVSNNLLDGITKSFTYSKDADKAPASVLSTDDENPMFSGFKTLLQSITTPFAIAGNLGLNAGLMKANEITYAMAPSNPVPPATSPSSWLKNVPDIIDLGFNAFSSKIATPATNNTPAITFQNPDPNSPVFNYLSETKNNTTPNVTVSLQQSTAQTPPTTSGGIPGWIWIALIIILIAVAVSRKG
jgi:hypothetical protein